MKILEAPVFAIALTLFNFLAFGLNSEVSAIRGLLSGAFLLFSIYVMAKLAVRDFLEDKNKDSNSKLNDEIETLKTEIEKLTKIISEKE